MMLKYVMLFRNYVNVCKHIKFKEVKGFSWERLLLRCLYKFIVMLMGCIIFRCWGWGQGQTDRGRMCQCKIIETVLTSITPTYSKIQTQPQHKTGQLNQSHLPTLTPTNHQHTKNTVIQIYVHHNKQTPNMNMNRQQYQEIEAHWK